MTRTFETIFGDVTVRNAMLEADNTSLYDGVEITGDFESIEIGGYHDIKDWNAEHVEDLIEKNSIWV